MIDRLESADISTLADALRRRVVSPVDVVRAVLDRIAAEDGARRIFVSLDADGAMAAARRAEAEIGSGAWRGPLHGVPIAVKDLVRTRGMPTTGGSPVFSPRPDDADASVVTRLKDAGAILVGKLAMTEAAFFAPHPTVVPPANPWGREFWTGASSSGPAVAVAARLCPGAIGSDTGGSIRIPAACCGVTGLKPTFGRVSRRGTLALSESLDHLGPLARSAADVAILMDAMAGHDGADPASLPSPAPDYAAGLGTGLTGLRIGIDDRFASEGTDDAVVSAFRAAQEVLAASGASLAPIAFPPHGDAMRAWSIVCAHEAWHAHRARFAARRADYGPLFAGFLETGRTITASDIASAHREQSRFGRKMDHLLAGVDAILLPTMPIKVPSLMETQRIVDAGATDRINHFTQVFNLTGHPAISFPAGLTLGGPPIGLQLVARRDGENDLCRAVDAFQRVTDWHRLCP